MPGPIDSTASGWSERTSADLSSLLVELSRLLKGLRFYNRIHPERKSLLDRAFMAWQGEITRAGPVDLWLEPAGIRCAGVRETVGRGHLDGLVQALTQHEITSLRVGHELTRESFEALAVLLVGRSDEETRFVDRLRQRSHDGICVNGEGEDPLVEAAPAATEAEPIRAREPAPTLIPVEPKAPAASLASALLAARPQVAAAPGPRKPVIDQDPLNAPGDPQGEELRRVLAALDRTHADATYATLAARAVEQATYLADRGCRDEGYRALLVLTEHAVGGGGRSGAQARIAQAALGELASGSRLDDLVERACSTQGSGGVRPAQVLLQLGERALPSLLDRLETESDPSRAGQLTAVVIALGERGLPTLLEEIGESSPERARIALRLAGELQNPLLVPTLIDVVRGARPELRAEAARALVHFGGPEALDVLTEALSSSDENLARVAASSLAELADRRALEPLLETLDDARRRRRRGLAREAIRALGEIGAVEAVPRLVSLLGQRSWLPSRSQALKIAAVHALAKLPGREVERALVRAGAARHRPLRDAARKAIEERRASAAHGGARSEP